jgi:hypothetical protein
MKFRYRSFVFVAMASVAVAGMVSPAAATIIVANGGFQDNAADFDTDPGYVGGGNPTSITSWTSSVGFGHGINGPAGASSDPFYDNGLTSTNDDVAFIQSGGLTLSQLITGLTIGQTYELTFEYNARNNNDTPRPGLIVSVGDDSVATGQIDPVNVAGVFTNPFYGGSLLFTAGAASETLTIQKVDIVTGDSTALFDNFEIQVVPEPSGLALLGFATVALWCCKRRRDR